MPIQPTLQRSPASRSGRTRQARHRVMCPTVGQCFDIEITHITDGWMIRIPEIGAVTRASRRAKVEWAARECIATRTGIPVGYVFIAVVSEIG